MYGILWRIPILLAKSYGTHNSLYIIFFSPLVKQVYASDLDSGSNGLVRYQIVDGDYDGTFAIDSASGTVTLRKPIALLLGKVVLIIKSIHVDFDERKYNEDGEYFLRFIYASVGHQPPRL